MNKVKLLEQIAETCNIHFYDYETENDTVVAKSHFLKFELFDDKIVVSDKTMLPGHLMKTVIDEYLPFTIRYTDTNFTKVLLDTVEEVNDKLFYAEYREEHDEE
jgi:hypothetical protein